MRGKGRERTARIPVRADERASPLWRSWPRSFRARLMVLVALAVSVPALLTSLILGFQLDRQARSLFANELAANLETFSVILQDTENNLNEGLARAAADNTLQITLDLDMRSQLTHYIEAQRRVLRIAFLGVYDSGARLMAFSNSQEGEAMGRWLLTAGTEPTDDCVAAREARKQLASCGGVVYLVSVVPIVRLESNLGDAASRTTAGMLGYVMGGTPVAGAELIASLHARHITHPLLWAGEKLVYADITADRLQPPARLDGSAQEYTLGNTAYLLAARTTALGTRKIIYGVLAPLAPLRTALLGSVLTVAAVGVLLVAGTLIAVGFFTNRLLRPIQQLREGAAQIGSGDLGQRITISTGDELEALGDQFNSMAAQLQDSYANLERKVEERTHQLKLANLAKSRFLAAASHDLRQPLHALNLFVAQLRAETNLGERREIVGRIETAVAAMNELFNALLDMSKLDAGVIAPNVVEFPVLRLLNRIETTFAATAREKGLRLRIVSSTAWLRSDPILLERILLNLVSNAVRYTAQGGVVVGCRHRDGHLRIEVCDSGIGIPEDQQRTVFSEFYQLAGPQRENEGLGLGLAIVDRLCGLLDHSIELTSRIGQGSRFAVSVPLAAAPHEVAALVESGPIVDPVRGKLVVVIDDDALVLESMHGLLRCWGCSVVTAGTESEALMRLAAFKRPPDLIISDFRLGNGKTGITVIERLRAALDASIPAFLISGDTAPERLREASAGGHYLLHKPVPPMTLRAMVSQLLRNAASSEGPDEKAAHAAIVRPPAAASSLAPLQ
jgi:signal transduction histidine kinase/FixJ family two-component response regulator